MPLPTGTDHLPNCHSDRECAYFAYAVDDYYLGIHVSIIKNITLSSQMEAVAEATPLGGGHERSAVCILLQGVQCQQFNEGRKFGMAVVPPSVETLGMTQCKSPNLK